MKNHLLTKSASVIAVVIGILPIITGTKVLTGTFTPNYTVLTWLVIYNITAGFLSIAAGILIWKPKKISFTLTSVIAAAHITVLSLLLTVFSSTVSTNSVKAMVFRSVVWIVIFIIVSKNNKSTES